MAEARNGVAQDRIAPHPVLSRYYVSEEDRRERVDQMFNDAAAHYDWINSVMSFGSGERYRRQALERIGFEPGMTVLDAGAGTGVVAKLEQELVGPAGTVVALDPSKGMLGEASKRGVHLATQGLGELLPFADNCFDRITMAYALRHVVDLRALFQEYRRVLKPGGRLLVLEISRPQNRAGHLALNLYMKSVVPTLTRLLRRSAPAEELMRYYWDTIEHCVAPATILDTMSAVGLAQVDRHLTFGTFSEYSATKP